MKSGTQTKMVTDMLVGIGKCHNKLEILGGTDIGNILAEVIFGLGVIGTINTIKKEKIS
jgi:hypothetical protein